MATKKKNTRRKKARRPDRRRHNNPHRRTTPVPDLPPPVPFEPDERVTHPKQRAFLIHFAIEGNVASACRAIGMPRSTHYDWLQKNAIYAEVFNHAEQHAGDALELIARLRAKHGSDVLLIFLLKGIKPERYRERHEVTGAGGSPLVPAVVHVSYHKDMEPPPEADIPPPKPEPKP